MKITRILLGAAITAALTSAAFAADMPAKAPVAIVAPATWAGFYVGANVGYAAGQDSSDLGISGKLDGVAGGLQAGYNWQFGNVVAGIEGDAMATNQAVSSGPFGVMDRSVPWLATARGRLGYALGNVLLYGTGGAAFGQYTLAVQIIPGEKDTATSNWTGWTAGAGAEWMFLPRWSAKAEWLHIDSGSQSLVLVGTNVTGKLTEDVFRAGVNYHF